ncbi:hypothetical protein M878_08855 [Streptomyces roseochromogenus subsp. oscitans DS 12.976]|uniref:Uncharacterized protein n=1 Tax=Streptomyces roseochromogenus subsp. oscitans DS 12.976 TaxID=1352936 RepID=V6KTQ2_STRRC|nr:hypothetical protein M878_08855 [Streptomyces roseochromogenus subsp. oscitans DS 12.976]
MRGLAQKRDTDWQGVRAGSRPVKYERGGTPIRTRHPDDMCDWSK